MITRKSLRTLIILIIFTLCRKTTHAKIYQGTETFFKSFEVSVDESRENTWRTATCSGVYEVNGIKKMCVDDQTPCTITSPKFDFTGFPGGALKVIVENPESINSTGINCNCVGSVQGTLVIVQDNGPDSIQESLSVDKFKIIDALENIKNIQFTLTLTRLCHSTSITVKILYFECNRQDKNLVIFPTTSASGKIQQVDGKCFKNAVVEKKQPVMTCFPNGSYNISGSCVCEANYEEINGFCVKCKPHYFKNVKGNQACVKCEENSIFQDEKCKCIDGYARVLEDADKINAPCLLLPKEPVGIYATGNKTYSSLSIIWKGEDNFVGQYIVTCLLCEQKKIITVTKPEVIYKGLRPNTYYKFTIKVDNEITRKTGKTVQKTFGTSTPAKVPGKVKDFRFSPDTRFLSWAPIKGLGAEPIYVLYFSINGTTPMSIEKNQTFLKMPRSVKVTAEVQVTIYAKVTDLNGFVFRGPTTTINVPGQKIASHPKNDNKKGTGLNLIIGGTAGGVLFVLFIIIIILLMNRHRKPHQFEVTRMEDGTMTMPRMTLFKTSRLYVDPTTYSHVDDAVEEFTLELDRTSLTMNHLLGGGEFANVFKGILSTESRNSDVAIKVLKNGASRSDRDDFLSEAAILGQFSDPNVISIEGVVLKDHPNLIVLEYMSNGSLDKHLVKNDSQFTIQKLLGMSRGVSSGMKYLSELGYIHRDLAARNVLVNNEDVCKIADFGMSRELKTDDTYDTKGGKIPIKWTAPEAIEYKKFTTASDVWSYGVLLWEIFSYGERPYWEWNNLEVMERVSTGYRLPPPMECPKVIHDLMLQCWHKDRLKRPRFSNILQKLEDWLKHPDQLTQIASVITKRDEDLDYSLLEDLSSWLSAINMNQYLKVFTEAGYISPKDILYLTNEDLEALGIGLIGHRKKLLKAIKNTRNQTEEGRKLSSSSVSSGKSNKVKRSTSFAGFGNALTKKVSFLASPNSSLAFKKTTGKRASLGYKLQ